MAAEPLETAPPENPFAQFVPKEENPFAQFVAPKETNPFARFVEKPQEAVSKDFHEFLNDIPPELEKKMVDAINAHAEEDWKKEVGPVMAGQLKQHYAQRAQGVKDEDQPIFYLPKPGGTGSAASFTRGVEQSAEGLVTLKNIGMLGSSMILPKPLQKLVGGVFLGMMAKGAAEEVSTALDPTKTKSERLEAAGRGAATAALAGLGAKAEFGRPLEGGALPPARTGGLTPDEANTAATQNQLRALAPETAAVVEPKPKGDPEVLDGLTLARRKLTEGFSEAPAEQQKVRQKIIDHIDDTLLQHDKDAVSESAARTAQPESPTTPPAPAGAGETAPGPSVQGSEMERLKQQMRAGGAPRTADELTNLPVEEPPTPPAAEETKPSGDGASTEAAGGPSPIVGPAMLSDGEVVAKGEIGQSHADLIKDAVTTGNVDAIAGEHGFHDEAGKPLTRTETADRALATGQIDQATFDRVKKGDGLHSEDLTKGGDRVEKENAQKDEEEKGVLKPEPAAVPSGEQVSPRPEEKRTTEAPPDVHEQHAAAQDKLSELQAELDFQIEEGTPHEELAGLRKVISDQRKKARVLKEQSDQSLLQSTDAPHTAPVANAINPKIAEDISPQKLGIIPKMPPFLDKLTSVLAGVAEHPSLKDFTSALKGWLGGMAGKTFPRLTALNREVGELAACWISSRIAARPSAALFSSKVLEGTGVDPLKFGAALHEDNLRSVRKGFEDSGDTDSAENVNTIIGGKGSPFKTEADYQAFLADPKTQQAIATHKAMWEQVIDPMYKQAMGLDPDETLPSRGLQTGARINLNPLREDEPVGDKVFTVGRGNLLGTLRKKSSFGIQAKGTGTGYGMNYHDVMANTFGKQLEVANKNRFEDALVEARLAKVEAAGQPIEVNGREGQAYPYRRQSITTKDGQSVSVNRNLYVDPRIADEYEIGANVQKNAFARKASTGILSVVSRLNRAALAGLTDATVHVSNLASALFTRPSGSGGLISDTLLSALGRADVPVTIVKGIMKGLKNNDAQFKELAEIGAMRAQHEPTQIPVLKQMSQAIQWADKTTRLVLDDTFKHLVKSGLVENTETNRREFVNQVGQYNKRAQGAFTRFARDSGLAPFVTAGKTFNALGVRTATLSPGVEATSLPAAAALRGNLAAKWVGAGVLVGALNYMTTGKLTGRDGVPVGGIDTGKTDSNGRPLYIKAFDILGLGRALRVTGARGALEAKRGGLTNQDALDSATRDIINSAIAPFTGPAVRFAATATGLPTAIGAPRQAPVAAPGESQRLSDVKTALVEANPIIASVRDANKPGGSLLEAAQRQLPRYLPQSGKPDEMMAKYPQIVEKAQSRAFINDVIGRARKLDPDVRQQFLRDALTRLPESEREKAEQTLQYSHLGYFAPPRVKLKKR